jgi:dTDP-4-dehydrorhamnose 3,5-epimerase-like enzyme
MDKVRLINFPYCQEDNGDLVVIQGMNDSVPFHISRVFNVRADKDSIRGQHAHSECTQLLVCTNGSIEVSCDDGEIQSVHILNKPYMGLLILPGVWAEQKYLENSSILTVLCDQPFNEEEYIRNYDEFKKYLIRNN